MLVDISVVVPEEVQSVPVHELMTDFAANEPMCQYLGDTTTSVEFVTTFRNLLMEGCSVKAVDLETNQVVGVLANHIIRRDEGSTDDDGLDRLAMGGNMICKLLIFKKKECDLFSREFNGTTVDLYMKLDTMTVLKEYAGKGIATQLLEKTIELAKSKNIPLLFIACSNNFSSKIAEKFGFTEIHSIKFNEFQVNGQIVIDPPEPHSRFRCFVKDLRGRRE